METVRTILSADKKRGVFIISKGDGVFDYLQQKLYDDGNEPFWAWVGEQPNHEFSSADDAERDARKAIGWLRPETAGGA